MEPLPPEVRRAEDVTAELLGAVSEAEVAAFRMAVLQTVLHLEIAERTAILLLYGDGEGWRERVADVIPIGWGVLTGEIDLRPDGLRAPRTGPEVRHGA